MSVSAGGGGYACGVGASLCASAACSARRRRRWERHRERLRAADAAAERLPPPIPSRLSRDGRPELLIRVLLEGSTEATSDLFDKARAAGCESDRIEDRPSGLVEDAVMLSGQRIPGWGNISVEVSRSQPLDAKHHGVLVCVESQDLSEGDGTELSCSALARALARRRDQCETALAVVTPRRISVEPFAAQIDAVRASCAIHGLVFYEVSSCSGVAGGVTPLMALRSFAMQVLDRNETDLGDDGRFRERRGLAFLRAEQVVAWGWAMSCRTASSARSRPSVHARATNVSASSLPYDIIRMVAEALCSMPTLAPCCQRDGEGNAAASCRSGNEAWQSERKRQTHQRGMEAQLEHYSEADELLLRRFLAERLQEQRHQTGLLCGARTARARQQHRNDNQGGREE